MNRLRLLNVNDCIMPKGVLGRNSQSDPSCYDSLTVQGKRLGLLNVGSPGKEHFSEGELALLQSVAYQIGTAVERTKLSEQREKQAVDSIARFIVDYYAKASKVTRYLWKINDMKRMLVAIVESLLMHLAGRLLP